MPYKQIFIELNRYKQHTIHADIITLHCSLRTYVDKYQQKRKIFLKLCNTCGSILLHSTAILRLRFQVTKPNIRYVLLNPIQSPSQRERTVYIQEMKQPKKMFN